MRGLLLLALVGVTLTGCLGGDSVPTGSGGNGAGGAGPGTGGATGQAGTTGTAGTSGAAGTTGVAGTGGSAVGGAGDAGTTGTAGTTGVGGSSGTTGTGGVTGSGGGGGTSAAGGRGGSTGGTSGSGGSGGGAGTTGRGGMSGSGGTAGAGGAAGRGGATGTGGTTGSGGSAGNFFPMPLRVDDPCSSLLGGNTCLHQGKTSDNGTPFSSMASITVGGTTGTTYQVKIHIRGVVEPTHIMGGTAGTPTNFITGGSAYADNTNEGQYQQWRLTTTVPNQHYYLNVYTESLSHIVKLLDFPETIPIGGGSIITLDVHDGNAHEISNTVNNPPLAPAGCPGSMNSGQFVQIDADSYQ